MEPTGNDGGVSQWLLGVLGGIVATLLGGWNMAQQYQINSMRERQDELRDLIAHEIREGLETFRGDVIERHRENIDNIRQLREQINRLGERLHPP